MDLQNLAQQINKSTAFTFVMKYGEMYLHGRSTTHPLSGSFWQTH
jgi:hypothetical protein